MSRALVIGGGRGIGSAVVQALAASGADVTFTYRTAADAAAASLATLRTLYPHATFQARALDLADRASVAAFSEELAGGDPLGALVQVGGTTYNALAAMLDQDAAERLMQVNFWAFTQLARGAVRPMTRARSGRIIAIGSVIGQLASPGNAAYGASKAALLAYVKTLAIETARRGVTVNYVAPGFIDTDMLAPFAEYRGPNEQRIPAGRYGLADEVAAVVAFLASPSASYVTGAIIPVDGGLTASVGVSRG